MMVNSEFKTFTCLNNQYLINRDTGIWERVNIKQQNTNFFGNFISSIFDLTRPYQEIVGESISFDELTTVHENVMLIALNGLNNSALRCDLCFQNEHCNVEFNCNDLKTTLEEFYELNRKFYHKLIIDLTQVKLNYGNKAKLLTLFDYLIELNTLYGYDFKVYLDLSCHDIFSETPHEISEFTEFYVNSSKYRNGLICKMNYRSIFKLFKDVGLSLLTMKDSINYIIPLNKNLSVLKVIKMMSYVANNVSFKIQISDDKNIFEHYDRIEKLKSEYDDLTLFLLKKARYNDTRHLELILNDEDVFGKYIKRLLLNQRVSSCSKNKFILKGNQLTVCNGPKSLTKQNFDIGEVESLLNDINGECTESKCDNCPFVNICGGECKYFYQMSNNLKPNYLCEMRMHLIQLSIYLVDELAENYPHVYNRLSVKLKR